MTEAWDIIGVESEGHSKLEMEVGPTEVRLPKRLPPIGSHMLSEIPRHVLGNAKDLAPSRTTSKHAALGLQLAVCER